LEKLRDVDPEPGYQLSYRLESRGHLSVLDLGEGRPGKPRLSADFLQRPTIVTANRANAFAQTKRLEARSGGASDMQSGRLVHPARSQRRCARLIRRLQRLSIGHHHALSFVITAVARPNPAMSPIEDLKLRRS
jgi:hypothetical protein